MVELTLCLDPAAGRPLYQQLYDSLTEQMRTAGKRWSEACRWIF